MAKSAVVAQGKCACLRVFARRDQAVDAYQNAESTD